MKIIICEKCEGEGIVKCTELSDDNEWTIECSVCGGSGRMTQETWSVLNAYEPKEPDKK